MKSITLVLLFLIATHGVSQEFTKSRIVIGISSPEMLHVGFHQDLSNKNQLGASFGVGPSWGMIWTSINLEHRLYLGAVNDPLNKTRWFCRQGFTDYPEGDYAYGISIGGDLKSKKEGKGWTIDAGAYRLTAGDSKYLLPVLRFQHRFQIKK